MSSTNTKTISPGTAAETQQHETYLDFAILYQMLSHGFDQNLKEKPGILKRGKREKHKAVS